MEAVAALGLGYGPDLPAGSLIVLFSSLVYALSLVCCRLCARRAGLL
jgi:hypothetical protein